MFIGAEAWPWVTAAVLGFALAAWLLGSGTRLPVVRALAAFLSVRAVFDLVNGLALQSGDLTIPEWILPLATFLVPGAAVMFYGAYHADGRTPPRWARLGWVVSIGLVVVYLVAPGLWIGTVDGVVRLGPLFLAYGLIYLLYAALSFDLGRHALKAEDLRRRRSYLWMGLGFAVLPAYVALSDFVFINALHKNVIDGTWVQVTHWVTVAAGFLPFFLFMLLARDALRSQDEQAKVDVAWILAALVLPAVSVGVLVLLDVAGQFRPSTSIALEGIWSVVSPLLIAFTFARYGAFGLEVRARKGLRWMLFVAVFPAVYVLGYLAGRNSIEALPPWAVGLIFVGVLVPFVTKIHRAADGWALRILGRGGEA